MIEPRQFPLRSLLLQVLLLLFVALPMGAHAQGENLEIEARLGFDGYFRPGAWTPVFVSISNQPAAGQSINDVEDFVGQLMLISAPSDAKGRAMRYVRNIDVPRASNKRYVLFVRLREGLTPSEMPRLTLNAENGKFLRDMPLDMQEVPKNAKLLVNVTDDFSVPSFPRLRNNMDAIVTARLSPSWLPDHWATIDGVDILVFPKWPDLGLREEQAAALREWVALGGTLTFLGGQSTQAYNDPLAKELLPAVLGENARLVESNGQFTVTRGALSSDDNERSYLLTTAVPKRDAKVLLAVDDQPIAVQSSLGEGQLLYFGNDLQAASTALEGLLGKAWFAAVPLPNYADWRYEFPDALRQLKILSGRAARPPNAFLIIAICIIYTLVVGPVNFALLGRRKKLEWAWLTVPTIVLFFFFLIYGLGRVTKGGDSILREIDVEQFAEGTSLGSRLTVSGTFVSSPGRYAFQPMGERQAFADAFEWNLPEEFRSDSIQTFLQAASLTPLQVGSNSPVISQDSNRNTIHVGAWNMGIYESALFKKRGTVQLDGAIDADVFWGPNGIEGTITNGTARTFTEAWVAVGSSLVRLGPVAAGETVEVPVASGGSNYVSAETVFGGRRVFDAQEDEELDENNFAEIMMAMFQPAISGQHLPPMDGTVHFIGRHNVKPGSDVMTNMEAEIASRVSVTMVRLDAPPRENTTFRVGYRALAKRLHRYGTQPGGGIGLSGDSRSRLALSRADAVFSLELPFSHPGLVVTEVTFDPTVPSVLQTEDLQFEVFQHSPRPGWVPLERGVHTHRDWAQPVNGRMYIRVNSVPHNRGGSAGWSERTLVSSLGVTLGGVVESTGAGR